jgi:UDP-N-acetyl-D-mannosaminuronic acid dehydrogenase
MCKLMENTYRDVNIALANTFSRIGEDAGVNVWEAIELSNLHPRVKILKPGPGVGGHCIPVDPWFLVEAFPQHSALLRAARETNDGQASRILYQMMTSGSLKSGDKLAILGAAYKADIDDARESPAALLAKAATTAKIQVSVHDPLVRPGDHHGLIVSNKLEECLSGAAAAALLTEHKSYRSLSSKVFAQHMTGRLIFDARNWLNHKGLQLAGFRVMVLGDGAHRNELQS